MPTSISKPSKSGDVAERSPAVFSANLKEDILLGKQVHVLNRSERSVVHRIKVEQKVMYRQFQSRLVRSKLAMARIMGNKNLEKELRSKNLGGLHTDIVAEEDYGFLAKLEHRPCTATQYIPPHREMAHGRENMTTGRQASEESGTSSEDQTAKHSILLRASTTVGVSTTADNGALNKTNHLRAAQNMFTNGEMQPISKALNESAIEQYPKINKATGPKAGNEPLAQKPRPKTVTIVTHIPDDSPMPSPRQFSRRASKAADFFEEDKKIDMVELRLKAARSLDYTDRVQQFCGELEEMGSGQPHVDYYSLRLHAALEEEPVKKNIIVPRSPEDGDMREVGNLKIRSLTLPTLNLKFDDV